MTASTRKALRAFVKTVPHLRTHIVRAVGLAFWGSALAAACVLASHREISTGRPRFRNCLTSLLQSTIGFLGNGIGLLSHHSTGPPPRWPSVLHNAQGRQRRARPHSGPLRRHNKWGPPGSTPAPGRTRRSCPARGSRHGPRRRQHPPCSRGAVVVGTVVVPVKVRTCCLSW